MAESEKNDFLIDGFPRNEVGTAYKVLIYIEYQSVCPSVGTGTLPPPLPQANVHCAPPSGTRGGHIRLLVRVWGSPNFKGRRKLIL
jgi:hypothetical protein